MAKVNEVEKWVHYRCECGRRFRRRCHDDRPVDLVPEFPCKRCGHMHVRLVRFSGAQTIGLVAKPLSFTYNVE